MSIIRDPGAVAKTLTAVAARDPAAASKPIAGIKIRDGDNVLQTIGGGTFGFSAVASPNSVVGNGASDTAILVSTASTSVTVSGGTPPYTISWSNPNPDWEATDPGGFITNFVSPYLDATDVSETDFTGTVTDSNGATTDTNTVHAKARNRGGTS